MMPEKSAQAGLLSACFQLIFDESEHCRQIETDSSPSSGFSLRALVAFTPATRLTLTKLFAIFLHKTDVFLR